MKLKAFSLLEVLVAILISGIVISTAYSVYIYTHQQLIRYQSIKNGIRDYFELTTTLNRDFENAEKILKKDNYEIEMMIQSNRFNYQIHTDYILRISDIQTDTFFFTTDDVVINHFDGTNHSMVTSMQLTINDEQLSFYKEYGAIEKINR